MADLSPDLSVYRSGLGAMDPGSLLGLVQRSRDLQSQAGIAAAIRANPNDPTAAYGAAAANPNVFMGPEDVSSFVHAQRAKSELGQWYMGQATQAISSLYTMPHPTLNDWYHIRPLLQQYGVPQDYLDSVEKSADAKTGYLDKDRLGMLHNFTSNNAKLPEYEYTAAGKTTKSNISPLYGQGGPQNGQATPTPPPRPAAAGAAKQQPAAVDPADEAESEVKRMYSGYGGGGGIQTNPSQAVQNTWEASAREYSAERGRDYQADTTPIRKALDILRKDPNATGRGLTEFNNIKNMLHSMGFIKDADMGSVVDFETLGKHFANLANSGSMSETDARLFQTIMGSASPDKLGETNKAVLRFALAMRNMHQGALTEFKSRVGPGRMAPEYFSDWRNSWAAKQDPMAFAWDTMSKEEQDKYGDEHFTGQPHEVWQTFESSLRAARRNNASK